MAALVASRIWPQLSPELADYIAGKMSSVEVACALRFVNKAAASQFRSPEHTTIKLSQPVPPHAFARQWSAPGAMRSYALHKRQQLVRLTAASGSMPNLEVALASAGFVPPRPNNPEDLEDPEDPEDWEEDPVSEQGLDLLRLAAAAGNLDACRALLERGYPATLGATAAAAAAGQQEVCELLLAAGAKWDEYLVLAAARGGHPDLMDWLLLRCPGGPIGPDDGLDDGLFNGWDIFKAAAKTFDLAALQALYPRCTGCAERMSTERSDWTIARATVAAAGGCTADWQAKVEWLESVAAEEQTGVNFPRVCAAAAGLAGRDGEALERLTWLRQRDYPVNADAAVAAAAAGNVKVLEHLITGSKALGTPAAAAAAAEAGKVEALKVLHARRCRINGERVAAAAAERGHLPVLVWAEAALGVRVREVKQLMKKAAATGSVELMAWLRERGCAWGVDAFGAAVAAGCEEALEWMAAQGCPMEDTGGHYMTAVANGDMLTVRCLARLGCPWGPVGKVFTACVKRRQPLQLLQCLAEAGCPVDWAAAVKAARRADGGVSGEVKAWLTEQQQAPGTAAPAAAAGPAPHAAAAAPATPAPAQPPPSGAARPAQPPRQEQQRREREERAQAREQKRQKRGQE